jgi:hypothetical protein
MVINDPIPNGSYVMLSNDAPDDLKLLIGSEAVMRVYCQLGGSFKDGVLDRGYVCRHLHRNRLTFDHVQGGAIPQRYLRVIPREEALGQKLVFNAQAEALGAVLADFMGR